MQMFGDIPTQRRFSLSNAFIRKTRHAFRVNNSKLSSKRTKLTRFLESRLFTIGILVPTIYMLFIHDLIYACGAPSTHALTYTIGSLDLVVFIIFVAEICCNIYAYRQKYVFSSLSVLDALSLISLVPTIIEGLSGSALDASLGPLGIARVARTARLASRLARLPKFVELLSCTPYRKHEEGVNIEPSIIARRLEFRVSTKIVLAMVILLIISWLCNPGLDVTPHAKIALSEMETVALGTSFNGAVFDQVFSVYTNEYKVLRLRIDDTYLINNEEGIKRTQQFYQLTVNTARSSAILSLQGEQTVIAALSITQTTCTILILCAACLLISRDTLVLVVHPIERMLSLIKKLTNAISAYTDSSINTANQSYDSDDDSSGEENASTGRFRLGLSQSVDAIGAKEADMLVEFVDILAHEHMEMDAQRKMEHSRRKALSALASGVAGWSARRRYQLLLKTFKKREHVANEILTTERTYVSSLQVLADVFMNPLKESGAIDAEAATSIFLGLDAIMIYNTEFLAKLERQFDPWNCTSKLGHIFLQLEDMVDVYSKFINNCTNAHNIITDYKAHNSKFAYFVEEQEKNSACNHLNISALMIMPVQRTPRYHLLLEQLLKYTPEDHPDYYPVCSAIEIVKKANNCINERKRETENRTALHNIYMRLEPPVEELMQSHCAYIRESVLQHEGDNYLFFLFNCILLQCHAKQGGVRLVVVNQIPITPLSIVTPIADSPHYGIKNAFQIESNLDKLMLIAPSQVVQAEWVDSLCQCIHKNSEGHVNLNTARAKSGKGRVGTLNLDGLKTASPRKRIGTTITLHKHDTLGANLRVENNGGERRVSSARNFHNSSQL